MEIVNEIKNDAILIVRGLRQVAIDGTAIFRREDQHKLQPPAEKVSEYRVRCLFHEPEITVRCMFHEKVS